MPSYHNAIQTGLIKDTSKARSKGFRHTGTTGDITEELFRRSLAESLPGVIAKAGAVTTHSERRHSYDSDQISSQCDVIITATDPWSQICDYILAPAKDVSCVIEVKYWVAPNNFESGNNEYTSQINRLKEETESSVFLVAFHHSGDREELLAKSNADETFIFATGSFQSNIQNMIYDGEYNRLIESIEGTLEQWAE